MTRARVRGAHTEAKSGTTAAFVGKPRLLPGRQRSWSVKAYKPGDGYTSARVRYIDPDTLKWTQLNPDARRGESLRDLFDYIESWLDERLVDGQTPTTATRTAQPTMNDLADRYLAFQRGRCSPNYVDTQQNTIDVWIRPTLGRKLVARWSVEDSETVLRAAREAGRSSGRIESIGLALSGMRKTAWRKPAWLPRHDDPLRDVSYARKGDQHGAARDYIPPRLRPETATVSSAVVACRLRYGDRLALQYDVAGHAGLRLGEQLGLRAVDLDFETDEFDINGAWKRPRSTGPYRGPVKTKQMRRVPMAGWLRAPLRSAVVELLGLPEDVSDADLAIAQKEYHDYLDVRAKQTGSTKQRCNVPVDEQLFVFLDPDTAAPWTGEKFNRRWHKVVALTRQDAGLVSWPVGVPYRNMRHHAAMWFKDRAGTLDRDWELVSVWLGNDAQTCRDHYVLPSGPALAKAASRVTGRSRP